MGHWKIGVKILCGHNKGSEFFRSLKNRYVHAWRPKIWGSKFYFFLVEPLVKILCSLKRGVKILYFFPVPWKTGVKTAEPTNQLHWRGAPPREFWPLGIVVDCVCLCVCPCVCVKPLLVRMVTHHLLKLGSPNLDQRCKTTWLRSLLFSWGQLTLIFKVKLNLKVKMYLIFNYAMQ